VEHSAVPDGAQAHLGGFQDGLVPVAEVLGPLRWDAGQSGRSASDASDGAHPDAAADAAHQLPEDLVDADAGISAVPAPDDPARDASFPPEAQFVRSARAELDAVAAPCRPDAGQFAEQSCAVQVFAVPRKQAAASDEARSELVVPQVRRRL
jgi:hypothetical protein